MLLTVLFIYMSMSHVSGQAYRRIDDIQSFREKLIGRTSSETSIIARFVQKKHMSVFNAEVISNGMFYWQNDNRICLDYQSPVAYRIIVADDKIRTVSSGKSTTVNMSGNPMMSQMRSLISSCMTGDVDELGKEFEMTCSESESDYKVSVRPLVPDMAKYISHMDIYLSKKDLSVNSLVIFENEEDYTGYYFSEKRFNETIPASVFGLR